MAYLDMNSGTLVANASETERAGFIRRTYLHLGGAIVAYAALTTLLIQSGAAKPLMQLMQGSMWSWVIVMALFMGASYFADKWAHSAISKEMQYAGLGMYVAAFSLISTPLIYGALNFAPNPNVLPSAALLTLMLAGGITFTAFTTRKNFSFLAPFITVGSFIALGVILASLLFGFTLGLVFFGIMIVFAGAVMLYQTSQMIHEYHTDQHVGASLGLFSSVGLMFWYIVQFMMSLTGND